MLKSYWDGVCERAAKVVDHIKASASKVWQSVQDFFRVVRPKTVIELAVVPINVPVTLFGIGLQGSLLAKDAILSGLYCLGLPCSPCPSGSPVIPDGSALDDLAAFGVATTYTGGWYVGSLALGQWIASASFFGSSLVATLVAGPSVVVGCLLGGLVVLGSASKLFKRRPINIYRAD